ncbi:MAG: hypothetical protein NUK63_08670 [Candidatus Bathyarchaeum tardum]|nr:MAG: hypothetical protein NUK63_08670 [Candidatus Bathyarchaeum tardum]
MVNNSQGSEPEFFVGVEYAIDNYSVEGCKALVDKVKNYTNVFIIDTVGITYDINNLNEVSDYVYDSGLHFYVFFIGLRQQQDDGDFVLRYNYYPHMWIADAKEKYGDKFLGAYAMDEPGGHQLDDGSFQMVKSANNQSEAAENFVYLLNGHISYYSYARDCENIKLLTAEYGLYWFVYKAGYDIVLVEYAWNHSRPLHTALCRGAANLQNKEWGVMVTWTYNDVPYIISGEELYDDLVSAYHAGAKYVTIFDHPDTDYSEYGILTDEHFEALEKFWNYVKANPSKHGNFKASAVYVLPENFGFGFRSENDNIWGLWSGNTDDRTEKIWNDVNQLVEKYDFSLDIVFSDPLYNDNLQWLYEEVFFWNEPID